MDYLPYHVQKDIFNYLDSNNKIKLIRTNLLDSQMTQYYLINKCEELENIVNSTLLIKKEGRLANHILQYNYDAYDYECSKCNFLQYESDGKMMGCRKHIICNGCEKLIVKTKCMKCAHVELSLDRRFIRMINECKGEYLECLNVECIDKKHYCSRCDLLEVMNKNI
jgi:hypothetical protein